MIANKKNFIFDWDGTLVDSQGVYTEIDKNIISHYGKIPRETVCQDRINFFIKNNNQKNIFHAYIKYLIDSYEIACSVGELYAARHEVSAKYLQENTSIKQNAELVLKELKRKRKQLLLATVSPRIGIERFKSVDRIKRILDMFGDSILTADDVTIKKPDPEIYLKALEMLKAKPTECIVIEDSLHGIEAAKRAGIEVVAMYDRYSNCDRNEINKLSDYQVYDYSNLLTIIKGNKYTKK